MTKKSHFWARVRGVTQAAKVDAVEIFAEFTLAMMDAVARLLEQLWKHLYTIMLLMFIVIPFFIFTRMICFWVMEGVVDAWDFIIDAISTAISFIIRMINDAINGIDSVIHHIEDIGSDALHGVESIF